MRTLAPGLYQIVPVGDLYEGEDDEGESIVVGTGFHTDAFAGYSEFEEGIGIALPEDFDPPFGIVDSPVGPLGTLILSLDLGDGCIFECTSVNSPLGPLTISDSYALMPTEDRRLAEAPGGQDETNWIVFEIDAETTVSVDGGRILIGGDVIDVASGPDFTLSTYELDGEEIEWSKVPSGRNSDVVITKHVIRSGTELHSLLMPMAHGEDDGVMAMLDTDAAGLAAVRDIDTIEARHVADELGSHAHEGFIGTVLHFYVKGNRLPPSAMEHLTDAQLADLVNA